MQPELVASVDLHELQTIRWGPLRAMFPKFVEEVELGRYVKRLLATGQVRAVRIEPHREPDGRLSTHIIDIYKLE